MQLENFYRRYTSARNFQYLIYTFQLLLPTLLLSLFFFIISLLFLPRAQSKKLEINLKSCSSRARARIIRARLHFHKQRRVCCVLYNFRFIIFSFLLSSRASLSLSLALKKKRALIRGAKEGNLNFIPRGCRPCVCIYIYMCIHLSRFIESSYRDSPANSTVIFISISVSSWSYIELDVRGFERRRRRRRRFELLFCSFGL